MNRKPLLGFLRYGALYAGLTVLAVRFVTTAELPFMAMFMLGLALPVFVIGIGDVRGTRVSLHGGNYDDVSQTTHIDHHTNYAIDRKLLFYGVSLAISAFVMMLQVTDSLL